MSAYLQYDKELFAGWSCHTHLTGLPGLKPSPLGQPWNILGRQIHDRIPYELPHFPNASWLNNGNVFHEWWGYNRRLLLSMDKSPKECIHKGGGYTRYDLQYYTIIDFNEVIRKSDNLPRPLGRGKYHFYG